MEENSTRAKQYSKRKTRLIVFELMLAVMFLLAMLFSHASLFLRETITGWSGNFYLQVGLYLSMFAGIYYLLFVGLDFYGGYLLEHKFLLSNQTVLGWVKKSIKKGLLSLLMLLAAGEVLYYLLRRFPNHWWLLATAAWLLLTVVVCKIAPVLIIPLFYKCSPLAKNELKERLLKLGKNCGVEIEKVFEIQLSKDTRKANAAVAGLGKGRRILLGDTLSRNYPDEEVEAIFAHELGHIRLRHTWRILGFGTVISFVSFYVTSLLFKEAVAYFAFNEIYDVAGFPLLALILTTVGLILLPIQNGYLRHLEKQADMFAIEHIEDPQSFASAMTKLADQNLADPSPGRLEVLLLYDHPPISRRLRYVRERKQRLKKVFGQ